MSEEIETTGRGEEQPFMTSGNNESDANNNMQETGDDSNFSDFDDVIPSPFQPANHKMAEYKEVFPGSKTFFARSGGPPKNDWSGIDDSKPRAKKSTM